MAQSHTPIATAGLAPKAHPAAMIGNRGLGESETSLVGIEIATQSLDVAWIGLE